MSFASDVQRFAAKVEQRTKDIFVNSVSSVKESITIGSSTSSSPGQPVQTGNLRGSWQDTFSETWVGEISTNVAYAEAIEEGQGPYGPLTLRSEVGGFHSVKKTVAGFGALVEEVRREVVRD